MKFLENRVHLDSLLVPSLVQELNRIELLLALALLVMKHLSQVDLQVKWSQALQVPSQVFV